MPRYKLIVAYDGTNYHGWQKQAPSHGATGDELPTVQGALEQAVCSAVREPVRIVGASRTDAGVHAKGQVAAFTSEREIPLERLPDAINARLPEDVQVIGASQSTDDFSPISDCVAKGYRYRVAHGGFDGARRPLFGRRTLYWTPYRLDVVRMNMAARQLIGEHDFASMTRLNHGRESTVRCIYDCQVQAQRRGRCNIDVCGNGFLYNMVRIIAGTLIEVGRGRVEPEAIPELLTARDRAVAGPTLPPEGLCLMWVKY
jgi:tRNA pseudouridine38-40 synthase